MKKTLLILLAITSILLLVGCSQAPAPPATIPTPANIPAQVPASPPPEINAPPIPTTPQIYDSAEVRIRNGAFEPATVTIDVGGTVSWINDDSTPHAIKFEGYETKPISPGGKESVTLAIPGTLEYTSGANPAMKGTIVVVE